MAEDTPLHFKTITEIAELIESKQLSPVELTTHMLDRIAILDGRLKSYATLTADSALSAARAAEREIQGGSYRGALHGVPIAVKDLCFTAGVRTRGGTRAQQRRVLSDIQACRTEALGGHVFKCDQ